MKRLFACWFGDGHYQRMARALEVSAKEHCPDWSIEVQRIESTARGKYDTNLDKLRHWVAFVNLCADGDELCLIDADTFIARPLDPVWELPFDVAIAHKRQVRLPFNAGVVFLRVNARIRAFMADWLDVNLRMKADRQFHLQYERTYSGINQAALGYMLERKQPLGAELHWLDAGEWNACAPQFWDKPDARIYHVKSQLRQQAQAGLTTGAYARALTLWRRYALV